VINASSTIGSAKVPARTGVRFLNLVDLLGLLSLAAATSSVGLSLDEFVYVGPGL
jgi:hypothetical protein